MRRFLFILVFTGYCFAAPAKPNADPLGRSNPQSAVTGFIEACHDHDYTKASQFLDLGQIPPQSRSQQGTQLARDLESLLNGDPKFDPLTLSQDPQGPPDADGVVTVAKVEKDDKTYDLQVKLQTPGNVWLFSRQSVALLPKLAPLPSTESVIEAHLPRFLVVVQLLETPIWVWLALVVAGIFIASTVRILSSLSLRMFPGNKWRGLHAWFEPSLMFLAAVAFRIAEEFVVPSAFARLFINRFLLLVVVAAIAWTVVNLIELFLTRIDTLVIPQQRAVSHSLIYLGRRTARSIVFVFAVIIVLDGWGFQMNAFIAGLGVSGIAVALAAQQTIANIFGGVSVIGDHPVMVGDFGNFGGVIGFVHDIGLRSTRIRTLSRTIVSVPNSSFAGMNLENYSERDKILFNPTLSVKRTTPKLQIEKAIESIDSALRADKRVEPVPTTVRITAITSAAFSVEIFCYVRTTNADEYYKIASDLYLKVDDQLTAANVELV